MKRRKLPKAKKGAWFIPLRGSYLPASWQGWALYFIYACYLVASLLLVIDNTRSVFEVCINIVPYWVSALIVMTWAARQKSR